MAGQEKRYRVEVFDGFWEALEMFPEAQQVRITELMAGHLVNNPKQMRPPLLKQLKGAYSHLRQFECGGPRRLLDELDDDALVARIVYLDFHPDWGRRGQPRP